MQASQFQTSFLTNNTHLSVEISSKLNEFECLKIPDLEDFLFDPSLKWKDLLEMFNVTLPRPDEYTITSGQYVGTLSLLVQDCPLILNSNVGAHNTIKFVVDYKTMSKEELIKASDEVQRYNFRDPSKSRKKNVEDSDPDYDHTSDQKKQKRGRSTEMSRSSERLTIGSLRNRRRPGPRSRVHQNNPLSASKLKEMEKEMFGEIRSIFRTSTNQATAALGRAPQLTNDDDDQNDDTRRSKACPLTSPMNYRASQNSPTRSPAQPGPSTQNQTTPKINFTPKPIQLTPITRLLTGESIHNIREFARCGTSSMPPIHISSRDSDRSGGQLRGDATNKPISGENRSTPLLPDNPIVCSTDSQLTERTDMNNSQSLLDNFEAQTPSPALNINEQDTEEELEIDVKPNVDLLALNLKKELIKHDDSTNASGNNLIEVPLNMRIANKKTQVTPRRAAKRLLHGSDEDSDRSLDIGLNEPMVDPLLPTVEQPFLLPQVGQVFNSTLQNGHGLNTPPLSERSHSSSGGRMIAIQLNQNVSATENQDRLLNKHARKFIKACDAASGRCEKIQNEVRNFRKKGRDETGWKPWAKFHDNCPTLAEVLRQMYDSSDSESD